MASERQKRFRRLLVILPNERDRAITIIIVTEGFGESRDFFENTVRPGVPYEIQQIPPHMASFDPPSMGWRFRYHYSEIRPYDGDESYFVSSV